MIVLHDIEADDLKTIVNFMYCGEIEVVKSEVRRLLKIAEILEISGLKDIRSSAQFQKTYAAELAPFLPENLSESKISRNIETPPATSCKPYYFRRRCHEIPRNAETAEKVNFLPRVNSKQITTTLSLKETSPDSNDGNNRASSRGDSRESQMSDKNSQKRASSENCQYLKKLRLLGEIDIIRCSESDETSPTQQTGDLEASAVLDQPENYGVFIKNEIDIPFDVGNLANVGNVERIVKKKLGSSSGIEIFKAQPKGFIDSMPGPSRSESLSPRSRNSVDSF
ncbi:uncharacterized protein LOC107043718 [Diachasma alloeum]|uniref:uncharacterized protein LOC107043718 n=1 Tax=Diachasma alloeum TaxID=454923 RepID=UPI00073833A5|nr:uncharacterized protein LOC107043718 [Diachasma alloeum]